MANYPTFKITDNTKAIESETLNQFYYEVSFIDFNWGKKYYLLTKTGLLAFKPMGVVFLYKSDDKRAWPFYVCRFANQTENLLLNAWDTHTFFENKEDYEDYMLNGNRLARFEGNILRLSSMLENRGYTLIEHSCWDRSIAGYYAYPCGTEPLKTDMPISKMWVDNDGFHIVFANDGKHFFSREDARKAMFKPNVVDFDDEEDTKGTTKVFELKVEVSVTATTKEIASAKLATILQNNGYNITR